MMSSFVLSSCSRVVELPLLKDSRCKFNIGYRSFSQREGSRHERAATTIPLRHAVVLSKALFETTLGANSEARRTVLFDHSPEFVLHRLGVRFGLPVLPEWAPWFTTELQRRGLVEELIGWNCTPIAVKGTKLRLLRVLGQGLRRKAIEIPASVQTLVPVLGSAIP